ncbi:hypothetical protein BKA62DRAFT_706675 [Auriculariales sp. MPI-PUGE-AT-0066]|nr:hypothetical protein BKA62DRAFT_706675 [Auriculariales sp. MPI-PUGE-AT-0066]
MTSRASVIRVTGDMAPLPKLQLDSVSASTVLTLPTPPPEDAVLPARRNLGDSELSYFLPSRADGVNDMYLHLGLTAPDHVFTPARVLPAAALLRLRHPLLASVYQEAAFVYVPPTDVHEALRQAQSSLTWSTDRAEAHIDVYLNGPRTLSQEHLSHIVISLPAQHHVLTPPASPSPTALALSPTALPTLPPVVNSIQIDLLICAAHFIGDGMALHTFGNELLQLLAGPDEQTGTLRTESQLGQMLREEIHQRFACDGPVALPGSLESGFQVQPSKFALAAARVDFFLDQHKCIGGHSFPRAESKKDRQTILQTKTFDRATTTQMLRKCKANGVSISTALFAACSIAWARTKTASSQPPTLPMMMYSAMNLRPYLPKPESYWFLSVGYFNVVLPAFLPPPESTPTERIFWHRARSAKTQSAVATNSPLLVPRASIMAVQRGRRARAWAREDDGLPADPADTEPPISLDVGASAPSRALLGLSLLGNLDAMYKHASYPSIQLSTLNTGSRQRRGGMLLFAYTFAGRLWLSFGWDVHGFDATVVERFWQETNGCLEEFLV